MATWFTFRRHGTKITGGELFADNVKVTASGAELNKLDGVTATTDEINKLNGVTATTAEINTLDGGPAAVVFTVGEDAGTTVAVTVQLNDANGTALAVRGSVMIYLSDDANGDSIAATAPSGGWAIGTDGLLIPIVTNKAAQFVSEADGDIDFVVTEAGAATWYAVAVLPNGKLSVSDAITFTA